MLSGLDKEQHEAVTLPLDSNALVLAGAGSGKTRVLTHRIAYLLKNGVPAHNILAVTFTNKAADEMRERLEKMLPDASKNLRVGTFHGIAMSLLFANLKEASLPRNFQVLNKNKQESFVKNLISQHFPSLICEIEDRKSPFYKKNIVDRINWQKDHVQRAVVWKQEVENLKKENLKTLILIYETYENECKAQNLVDFAEMILRVYEVLRDNEAVRTKYQQRFRYIFVDEFQDINRLQFKLISLLAEGGARLFVVGDDDQSIYGFRGSNVQFLHDFEKKFSPKIVALGRNYRSTKNIVEVANAVISKNKRYKEKHLWTENEVGNPVQIYEADNEQMEAEYVAFCIKNCIKRAFLCRKWQCFIARIGFRTNLKLLFLMKTF